VLVVGDVMVDIIVRPEGPLASGADRRASIRPCPGGSGANQAAWLAACNVKARFAGRVGCADHALQGRLLEAAGVEPLLGADETLPTGALVALIALDGERSFLTDRGANARLCRADLPITLLDGVDLLHVSGYALFSPGPRAAVRELMDAAGRRDIPVTVDPASHSCLEEVGPENFLEWTRQAHICFPNEAEAAMLAGTADPEEQLRALSRRFELVVIKRGAAGAVAPRAAVGVGARRLPQRRSSTRQAPATPLWRVFSPPTFRVVRSTRASGARWHAGRERSGGLARGHNKE